MVCPTDPFLNTAFTLVLGTYMSLSMVHYLTSVKLKKTVIDKLILAEQLVNLFGGLYHISMLLRLALPVPMAGRACNFNIKLPTYVNK